MSELSPKAKQLLQAARVHTRPSSADRVRVWMALGDQPPPPDDSHDDPSQPAAAQRDAAPENVPPDHGAESLRGAANVGSRAIIGAGAGIGLVLVGALIWYVAGSGDVSSPATTAASVPPSVAASASGPLAPDTLPSPATRPAATVSPVPPPPAEDSAPLPVEGSVNPSRDKATSLALEVSILSRATRALAGGHPAEALQELRAHRSRFPNGVLTEERRAATAEALCALGQHDAARAELQRLQQSSGQSPQFSRVKRLCAARGVSLDPSD